MYVAFTIPVADIEAIHDLTFYASDTKVCHFLFPAFSVGHCHYLRDFFLEKELSK